MKLKKVIKRFADRTPAKTPPPPLDEQLTDVARALIAGGHHDLASEVADVIKLGRGDITDSLRAVFEDLLISLDWTEMDPNEDEAVDIRATLSLIHKAGGR